MGDAAIPPSAPIESQSPLIRYSTNNVPPPSPLYVDVNDQLLLQTYCSIAGVTVTVNFKMLLPNGVIVPGAAQVTPLGNRTVGNRFIPLQEGFLLGATVATSGALVPRGACFVQVSLLRGYPAQVFYGQVLLSAYCSTTDIPTWPPGTYESSRSGQGNYRSIVGTTPAAGADISETCPTNAVWKLKSLYATLTTSATAANRQTEFVVDDGSHILIDLTTQQTATASGTYREAWSATGAGNFGVGVLFCAVIPPEVILTAGFRVRTSTPNLQAGDQWSAPQYLVEEWLGT